MDCFNFLHLPLEIQDVIVKEIVHNSVPDDWIRFAQTSKYSNWLVKRVKPKKIINRLSITSCKEFFTTIIDSKEFKTKSASKIQQVFQNCQIQTLNFVEPFFFTEKNTFWTPEFEQNFHEAVKFVTTLEVIFSKHGHGQKFINFYEKLEHLSHFHVMLHVSNVLLLPRLPPNIYLHPSFTTDKSDNFLEKLAQKTRDCPLSLLFLKSGFAVDDLRVFLQTATFFDGAKIHVETSLRNHLTFEKMMKSLGKHENRIVSFCQRFSIRQDAILLKENVKVVPRKVGKNFNGIFLICDLQ